MGPKEGTKAQLLVQDLKDKVVITIPKPEGFAAADLKAGQPRQALERCGVHCGDLGGYVLVWVFD